MKGDPNIWLEALDKVGEFTSGVMEMGFDAVKNKRSGGGGSARREPEPRTPRRAPRQVGSMREAMDPFSSRPGAMRRASDTMRTPSRRQAAPRRVRGSAAPAFAKIEDAAGALTEGASAAIAESAGSSLSESVGSTLGSHIEGFGS